MGGTYRHRAKHSVALFFSLTGVDSANMVTPHSRKSKFVQQPPSLSNVTPVLPEPNDHVRTRKDPSSVIKISSNVDGCFTVLGNTDQNNQKIFLYFLVYAGIV